MTGILGIDHVAMTVNDLQATCVFYDDLFGAEVVAEHVIDGKVLVRQLALGGAVLSVHQCGNGVALVAKCPTVGAADLCFRWSGSMAELLERLQRKGIAIIDGPSARTTADRLPSHSIFFRDIDGNLIELMTSDHPSAQERTSGS
jgi:catechol 2,3-dioxygenase-like lactoylglutathione lyase family enzyme